ncbi:MAG: hypothetical protein MRJ93_05750 [Nitrososphaeraceae archaeon]|nr:hypothetical protein [Nitrososphaeraceae archaeon]
MALLIKNLRHLNNYSAFILLNTMSQIFDYPLEFSLKMDLGQSYLVGKASCKDTTYTINIQGGRKGIVLPKELMKSDGEVIASFFTNSEKEIILTAKVSEGMDWIEIYDDFLIWSLANDIPTSLIIDISR